MDYLGDHIDNKFGGCDVPFDGKVSEVIPAEEQLALLSEAIKPVVKAIESILPAITEVARIVGKIGREFMQKYPNKRLVHLALHSKKGRTRKKNRRRIIKWLQEANNV